MGVRWGHLYREAAPQISAHCIRRLFHSYQPQERPWLLAQQGSVRSSGSSTQIWGTILALLKEWSPSSSKGTFILCICMKGDAPSSTRKASRDLFPRSGLCCKCPDPVLCLPGVLCRTGTRPWDRPYVITGRGREPQILHELDVYLQLFKKKIIEAM